MAIIDTLQKKFKEGNLPIKLIYLNVAIFIIVSLVQAILDNQVLVRYLGLNSEFAAFIYKPWTLFTYMFLHVELMHLLFNMLMLWVIGDFFYKYFGDKAFAQFYFLGGLLGGIFYLLFHFIYPHNSILMGASAAIYAALFAMVAYQPELKVRVMFVPEPIKLQYVAIGFILLGFLLNAHNLGGNISHVGGALFGYLYMKQFEKGNTLNAIFDGLGSIFKPKTKKPKMHVHNTTKPPKDDYEYADYKKQKEDKINQILEKISRSGYNSLNDEEKAFLFKQRGSKK